MKAQAPASAGSHRAAYKKTIEFVVGRPGLRFTDIGMGEALSKANPQQVLARLACPKDIYWKATRAVSDGAIDRHLRPLILTVSN